MLRFLALVLLLPAIAVAQPVCPSGQTNQIPCYSQATGLLATDLLLGTQQTGPERANQTVKVSVSQLLAGGFAGSFSTLAASGNATVGGTLGVTGAATLSGTLGVTGAATINGTLTSGTNTAASPNILVNGDPTTNKFVTWRSGGVGRWRIFANPDASGGNLVVNALDDTGVSLSNPLVFTRSSGLATFGAGGVTIQGTANSTTLQLNNTRFNQAAGAGVYTTTMTSPFQVSTSASGTVNSGLANLWYFVNSSDTVNASGRFLNGVKITHNFGGAGTQGSRQALNIDLVQTGATDNNGALYDAGFYVGAKIGATVAYSDLGGTGTTVDTAHGRAFAFNPTVSANAGALNLFQVSGGEINVSIDTGASAFIRSGLAMANLTGDQQGVGVDVAWWSYGSGNGGAPWRDLHLIGSPIGGWPMDATNGSIMRISPYASGRGGGTKWGFDFLAGIFPSTGNPYDGGLLRSNGISIDGAGTVQLGTVYIGATSTGIAFDAKGSVGQIADGAGAVASGGTGYTATTTDFDVAWDSYGGIYSLTVNGSGVVTSIKVLRQPVYPSNSPPGTALTTTVFANSNGTGLTITPSWATTRNGIQVAASGQKIGFYGTAPIAKATPVGACAGSTGCQALRDALGNLGLINTGSITN